MGVVLGIVIGVLFVVVWVWICRAVGVAADAKGRSRGLWTILAFMPLGPIIAPLWLRSLPVIGEKSTTGQIIGRTLLVGWLMLSLAARFAGETVTEADKQVTIKAQEEYGHETEFVSEHYRKMSVDEIVMCLTMSQTFEAMEYDADYDAANETHYFKTQGQTDTYNDLIAKYNEMECGERTYDVTDLDRAMKIIEGAAP